MDTLHVILGLAALALANGLYFTRRALTNEQLRREAEEESAEAGWAAFSKMRRDTQEDVSCMDDIRRAVASENTALLVRVLDRVRKGQAQ